MKDKWERSSQVRRLRKHPIHRCAVLLPQWGRLRYEDAAIPISSERIQDTWRKTITTDKAFPHGESKEEAASPAKKEANPASLRSAAPSKGRGSRGHSLLPMEGGAPKGRRLDGESGMKKSGEIVSSTSFAKAPYPPLFPTQSLPLGKADDTRIAAAHKALRHRPLYIRGEAATFIPLPYSSRAFVGHQGTARPMSYSSNPFSDIKERNLCV